jgi:hypothetical protein
VRRYIVTYCPENEPTRTRLTVTSPQATLPSLPAGTRIGVKAINEKGLEGWDWVWGQVQ